ncbi:PDR/VanB family oxidoreductase [Pseudoduganella sp. SL102]|uniref:PDR/VanB family oxidoreductase n=1 Tax=Pseudoduganella sp. SL102 TaxID=2995154 RepID=UPI00248AAC3D|nr:PDR/VanB family oxidoreductase [Pseudoduganella sp. SL102]WBS04242.1 PDR/VanB family oxidoreductase [Pseudoduganella sp. SL102]
MNCVIANVIPHGARVREFELRRADGQSLPAWRAGDHVVLSFASADGRRFENRYSLVGRPGDAEVYRIAVQREARGRGGSVCLHDEFHAGGAIDVTGPYNSFPLRPADVSGARVLLIAGGIGITPLVSMAHAQSMQDAAFTLHYLARTHANLILLEELRAIPGGEVITHLSQGSGRADLDALLGAFTACDSVYACGPVALLQALADAGRRHGWPQDALRYESFGSRADTADGPLTVELALSGITVEVEPGTPILDALISADAFVSYDCRRGECGNCYTPVLAGTPLHRDVCLTPAMRGAGMCTCVSWAAAPGRLVLEI